MLRSVESEEGATALQPFAGAFPADPIVPAVADVELETPPLPHDHPRWVRDAVALSKAARELLARVRPAVVRVLTMWDHRLRSIAIGNRRVHVDASGSYRVEN